MDVIWTASALADLDAVLAYSASRHPSAVHSLEQRIRAVVVLIAAWPSSAAAVEQHPDVRMVPLIRYPYRIFYTVTDRGVEILHLHHTARRSPL